MNFEPTYNIGDEVRWNGKGGEIGGRIIEIYITITKDSTFFSYLISLPNTMNMYLNETSIINNKQNESKTNKH